MADAGPIWNIQTRMHRKYPWTRPMFMAVMIPHSPSLAPIHGDSSVPNGIPITTHG